MYHRFVFQHLFWRFLIKAREFDQRGLFDEVKLGELLRVQSAPLVEHTLDDIIPPAIKAVYSEVSRSRS